MLIRFIYTILIFNISLFSFEFKVASYNVENLFDMYTDGTEYSQYIPNTKYWNNKSYSNKLNNISRVIKDLDADILGLQEIESKKAFLDLRKKVPNYKYGIFLKNKTSSVGVALLSKYIILEYKKITSNQHNPYSRYILKVTLAINNKLLVIYVNHWRSKKAPESKRIIYATALKNDIDYLDKNTNYIILGDLNSNYDEYLTFKYDKKLNNTYNITGINQVLNTTIKGNFIKEDNLHKYKQTVHYNLWLDINKKNRFSSLYKKNKNTPDHIIISTNMLNGKDLYYKKNSFNVFKANYLFKNKKINRWNKSKFTGYSDHLPIYAIFNNVKKDKLSKNTNVNINSIEHLYEINMLNKQVDITNIKVIYKYNNSAIITKDKDKAILVYKVASNLKVGNTYDISIHKIDTYFGLKEVMSISNIHRKTTKPFNYKNYYLDANTIDIFDLNYQNNIIKNLHGTYKKNYLHINNKSKKIKLFFDKNITKPKQNTQITITSGHLNIYKSQVQIRIHKQSDYK